MLLHVFQQQRFMKPKPVALYVVVGVRSRLLGTSLVYFIHQSSYYFASLFQSSLIILLMELCVKGQNKFGLLFEPAPPPCSLPTVKNMTLSPVPINRVRVSKHWRGTSERGVCWASQR